MKKNNKIKLIIFSLFGFLCTGLITYSTIYYSYKPLPTNQQVKQSLVTEVFNDYFNEKNDIIVDNEPKYWYEVIGSESKWMKNFYNDLYNKTKYNFTDAKISYYTEPILNENNIYIDMKLKINDLSKEWIYKGFINYKIGK